MKTRAIITSCSNKFFPSAINLLTSIKVNYPDHPPVYVYDLGLLPNFRYELERVEGVTVISMPKFCLHWRSCYTWKTYIFAHPVADLNLYIDAGCQVLKPLDEDFSIIENDEVLLVHLENNFNDMVPHEYVTMFSLEPPQIPHATFSAGIIGFTNNPTVTNVFKKVYAAAVSGLTLGFSQDSLWRNKGKDKSIFIRSGSLFRHDQTLVNLFFALDYPRPLPLVAHDNYSYLRKDYVPTQRIWHLRLLFSKLEYIVIAKLHKNNNVIFIINRLCIYLFLLAKRISAFIKNK